MYKITILYDGNVEIVKSFSDALDAFSVYLFKCVDSGFANNSATYNLELPNGKMYSKTFDKVGFVSGK